jgi:peptide/nickel transport system ATP-binding protein
VPAFSRRTPIDIPILEVADLKKHYSARRDRFFARGNRTVKAVDGVTFHLQSGEVMAIVGESGSGKSTLGRLVLRLLEPTHGTIRLAGSDITRLNEKELRQIRLTAQIVFQDPFGSLNPRMTVGASIAYPLTVNGLYARNERTQIERRVSELLERVGLNRNHSRRLPHELSGGQRQRVGIARAIAVNPKLLVLDEPVASLDLSAQARILNLFKELQREMGMSYLFITHDLSVARYMADRILVMYAGKVMEMGRTTDMLASPRHPYTQALLSASMLEQRWTEETELEGDPPSPIDPPPGCRFNPRCPYVAPICRTEEPPLIETGGGHPAACHLLTGKVMRELPVRP